MTRADTQRRYPKEGGNKPFPIPCRYCGKLSQILVKAGEQTFDCPSCHRRTLVHMRAMGDGWEILTALDESLRRTRKMR